MSKETDAAAESETDTEIDTDTASQRNAHAGREAAGMRVCLLGCSTYLASSAGSHSRGITTLARSSTRIFLFAR